MFLMFWMAFRSTGFSGSCSVLVNCSRICRIHTSSAASSRNYYDVLELTESCSAKDIRSKYVELCKKYHPDTAASGSPAEIDEKKKKFQEIQEAYNILSKENERKMYDSSLKGGGYHRSRTSSNPYPYYDERTRRAQQAYYEFRHKQSRNSDGWAWGDFWDESSRNRSHRSYEDERERQEYYENIRRKYDKWEQERMKYAQNGPQAEESRGSALLLCFSLILFGFFLQMARIMTYDDGASRFENERMSRLKYLRELRRRRLELEKEEEEAQLGMELDGHPSGPYYYRQV